MKAKQKKTTSLKALENYQDTQDLKDQDPGYKEIWKNEPDILCLLFPHGICIYQAMAERLMSKKVGKRMYIVKGMENKQL